mmetsp:Transcript_60177/g.173608  ORF Transcript_60177/g.173608 Transcript_60177/m.173608 type:complete len:250 (-) Transcript_60177:598-1347(-)
MAGHAPLHSDDRQRHVQRRARDGRRVECQAPLSLALRPRPQRDRARLLPGLRAVAGPALARHLRAAGPRRRAVRRSQRGRRRPLRAPRRRGGRRAVQLPMGRRRSCAGSLAASRSGLGVAPVAGRAAARHAVAGVGRLRPLASSGSRRRASRSAMPQHHAVAAALLRTRPRRPGHVAPWSAGALLPPPLGGPQLGAPRRPLRRGLGGGGCGHGAPAGPRELRGARGEAASAAPPRTHGDHGDHGVGDGR